MDSFQSRSTLKVDGKEFEIFRLDALDKQGISTQHLPFSLVYCWKICCVPKMDET